MKTLFVLYMLTMNYGQTAQVTKIDTFDSFSQCSKTADVMRDFYTPDMVVRYKAGIVSFMCIEKKSYNDVVETGE